MPDLNLGRIKVSFQEPVDDANDCQMESFRKRVATASANLRGLSVYREPDAPSDSWFVNIYFGQESRKLEGFSSAEEAVSAGLIDFYEAVVPYLIPGLPFTEEEAKLASLDSVLRVARYRLQRDQCADTTPTPEPTGDTTDDDGDDGECA
jgi:hypothetical protein